MRHTTLLAALAVLAPLSGPHAGEHKNFASLYLGAGTYNTFGEVLGIGDDSIRFHNARFLGAGYGRELHGFTERLRLEAEGMAIAHKQNGGNMAEVDAALLLRYKLPSVGVIPRTSVAFGEGLSLTSRIPPIENERHPNDERGRLLNLLLVEATADISRNEARTWQGVARVHHRSGVFGLFGGVDAGSNYYALGLRRRF